MPRSHPGDEEESCGKGSEDGTEGREGIDLSNDIACLGQVAKSQLDHHGRDHPENTSRGEEDDRGYKEDPDHQTGFKMNPSDQIGQGRDRKRSYTGEKEKPAESGGSRIPIRKQSSQIGSDADACQDDTDNGSPGEE